jgi:carbamoyl-phosphate synthase large subunit
MSNILITSAGRRVSLVQYFKDSAKRLLGNGVQVFTTDLEPKLSAAAKISDGAFKVGRFSDSDYMDVLLKICQDNAISLIIPTIDTELLLYAKAREQFAQRGIQIIVSDADFIVTCRDKRKINTFFLEHGFKLPKQFDKNALEYPFFVKPYDGSSSKNIMKIECKEMLSDWLLDNEKLMFMEYLSPKYFEEYTVDMLYDKFGNLKCLVPRLRIEIRHGEMSKGITRKNEVISFLKEQLSNMPGWRGCITLQLFKQINGKDFYGIEINPRFGGGYPLSYLAGADFPSSIIETYILNKEVVFWDEWKENVLLLRHDNEMIIENADI